MKSIPRAVALFCLFAVLAITSLLVPEAICPRIIRVGASALMLAAATTSLGWFLAQHHARKAMHGFVQGLIDAVPEPIYVKDARSHFVWVNEAFAEERRRPARELVGLSSYDLSPGLSFNETLAAEDHTALEGGIVFKEQHTTYPITGEECFRLVSKRRCFDLAGNPMILGAHFDITRMRLAETATQQALEREIAQRQRVQTYMQRLIDVIPQPVYVKDAESHYVMVNEAFCKHRMLGPDQLIGKSAFDLSGNRTHADYVEAEDLVVLGGEFIAKEECTKHPISGQDIFRYICKGTCLDADGHPVIVGANFDITEWRMAELRWRQASSAKSQFLATMSHEIRTPLSAVIGLLQLALGKNGLTKEIQNDLKTALSNAESLLGIISDILDFSKIEAGQLQIEHIDFDLPDNIHQLMQGYQAEIRQKGLACEVRLENSVPRYVKGDPTRLRQILINLVGNAVKFTEHGSITVSANATTTEDNRCRITFQVEDSGIGIQEEIIPNLFQAFQQGDTSTTRRFGGTGLGLAISRQLVSAMGGDISVRSEPGKGSCFEFHILLDQGQEPIPPEVTQPLSAHQLSILCAEDVRVNQLIIRAQLEGMGHKVDIVDTGLAAVRALAVQDYDLVLMDWRMPEMDGAEATRVIRSGGLPDHRVRNSSVRIVALTANASNEDRDQALSAGMDDYLTKPVREAQLRAVLDTTIGLLNFPNTI
jgi:signal transduction histidine kinase/ActR/RegA family two-component response regulator